MNAAEVAEVIEHSNLVLPHDFKANGNGQPGSGFGGPWADGQFFDDESGRPENGARLDQKDVANAAAGAGFPTIPKSRPGVFGAGDNTSPASLIARSSPLGKINSPVTIPTPTYSNLAAGTKNLGAAAGRLGPITGAVYSSHDIATSDNPWRSGIGHFFGMVGGALGATAGVAASTPTGWTTAPVVGTGGAIGGSYIGQEIGHGIYDAGAAIYNWITRE